VRDRQSTASTDLSKYVTEHIIFVYLLLLAFCGKIYVCTYYRQHSIVIMLTNYCIVPVLISSETELVSTVTVVYIDSL